MPARYPFPPFIWLPLAAAMLAGRQRSFRQDAQACAGRLRPPLLLEGQEHLPGAGPCLVTINHYHRPGFPSWWLTLSVSAIFPAEIHWIITSAWVRTHPLSSRLVPPASRRLFAAVARVYGFTNMPPMPPRPDEAEARAAAVREIIGYAKGTVCPVIGLSPEGRDSPDGQLLAPPPGVGRFILQLARLGLPVLPIGIFEAGDQLCLRCGPLYRPELPPGLPSAERDRLAGALAMRKLAALLPTGLRGQYL